jgi:hypothetical protein
MFANTRWDQRMKVLFTRILSKPTRRLINQNSNANQDPQPDGKRRSSTCMFLTVYWDATSLLALRRNIRCFLINAAISMCRKKPILSAQWSDTPLMLRNAKIPYQWSCANSRNPAPSLIRISAEGNFPVKHTSLNIRKCIAIRDNVILLQDIIMCELRPEIQTSSIEWLTDIPFELRRKQTRWVQRKETEKSSAP